MEKAPFVCQGEECSKGGGNYCGSKMNVHTNTTYKSTSVPKNHLLQFFSWLQLCCVSVVQSLQFPVAASRFALWLCSFLPQTALCTSKHRKHRERHYFNIQIWIVCALSIQTWVYVSSVSSREFIFKNNWTYIRYSDYSGIRTPRMQPLLKVEITGFL